MDFAASALGGGVPALTRFLDLELYAGKTNGIGSATNVVYDNIAGAIVPEPSSLFLAGFGLLVGLVPLRGRKK